MRVSSGPAFWVAVAVAVLVAGAMLSLGASAATGASPWAALGEPYIWYALRFTLWQAGLSTLLSVGLAIPVARGLARRMDFLGRGLIIGLFRIPLALPALVAVFGIVAVFGHTGLLTRGLMRLGIPSELPLYGLTGILIAHVFFNLPFAVLLLLARLEAIPAESWRLAAQLGLGAGSVFRFIEWPALKVALPGVAAIIFLLCVTSFTIVLTLGGGPGATTLEVAIYQALRFDFDPPRAVLLALLQMLLCGAIIMLTRGAGGSALPVPGAGRSNRRLETGSLQSKCVDAALIATAVLFIGVPMLSVILSGLTASLASLLTESIVWRAIATSLAIAACAASLSVGAAWALVTAGRMEGASGARALTSGGALLLVVPPFVIGAGWFLALNRFGLAFALAPLVLVLINALMTLPYAIRILAAADAASTRDHHRLCANLGLDGWTRFRLIDWPLLAPAIAFAAALCAALSLGDLGIAALFGSERLVTLPLLLHQRMGSYRSADAAGLALLLAMLCLLLFIAADRMAKRARA